MFILINSTSRRDAIVSHREYQDIQASILGSFREETEESLGFTLGVLSDLQDELNPFDDTDLVPSEVVGLCRGDVVSRADYINKNYVTLGCNDTD